MLTRNVPNGIYRPVSEPRSRGGHREVEDREWIESASTGVGAKR
jgi:hypothetical protein